MYKWNRQPYTNNDVEDVVETVVTLPNGSSTAAVKSKVSDVPGENHHIRVSFPTRKSGIYAVSVKVKGCDIPGSPFNKMVIAGEASIVCDT